jgi:hypothetical protein
VTRTVGVLFSSPAKASPHENIPATTTRDRVRANAQECGFVAVRSLQSDIDVFVRSDRIVHVRYGAGDRIASILVNSQCLFDRDRKFCASDREMAACQRAGMGLIYSDDGWWVADELGGDDKISVEARVNREWAATHRHCPVSARRVENPTRTLGLYRCPECGQEVGLTAEGKVFPHSVRTDVQEPRA